MRHRGSSSCTATAGGGLNRCPSALTAEESKEDSVAYSPLNAFLSAALLFTGSRLALVDREDPFLRGGGGGGGGEEEEERELAGGVAVDEEGAGGSRSEGEATGGGGGGGSFCASAATMRRTAGLSAERLCIY